MSEAHSPKHEAQTPSPRLTLQPPRFYTNKELDRIRELAANGLSAQQISDELGRSRGSIASFCKRFGIKLSGRNDFRHMNRSEQFQAILAGWQLARAKILAEIDSFTATWLPNGPSKAAAEAIQKRIANISLPISEDAVDIKRD